MLLAIMAMYWEAGTTDIPTLLRHAFPRVAADLAWLAFFASFAVKMPMWPVHTWLPDAHVEAPTAGSVILAAILLKMGGYGFLRFSLPMFPEASVAFAPLVFTLSVVAIVYTSLVALVQEDMKKLIAYSSVAHMGFVTMGIFAATTQGVAGGIFQMISHGIVSGALFLCVGVVYDRMHTREIAAYGGLVNRMPLYAAAFMVFTLANVGLPGHVGLHRRVPDADRHLPDQHLGRVLRDARRDPVGLLCAVALSQGDLRHARKPTLAAMTDLDGRELAHADAARRAHHPDRHLSEAGPRHVGGVGDGAARQLPSGARRGEDRRAGALRPFAMTEGFNFAAVYPVLPELILVVGAMALLMIGAWRGDRTTSGLSGLAVMLLVVAGVLIATMGGEKTVAFGGSFVVDRFAKFLKLLVLVGSIGAILLVGRVPPRHRPAQVRVSDPDPARDRRHAAADLGRRPDRALSRLRDDEPRALRARRDRPRQRARHRSRPEILRPRRALLGHAALRRLADLRLRRHGELRRHRDRRRPQAGIGLIFGLVFLFAGLCFKVSAVPFHMWTPDVYQGAPTPVTAFFAAAPKVAAIAIFMRVSITAFPAISTQWQQIVVFVSIASMALGSFAAIGQRNIKRLMAYSSIGHMGFALVGLAAGTSRGHPGRARLHGDLRHDDARHLRLHHRHAPQGQGGRGPDRPRRARPHQAGDWRSSSPC